MYDLSIIVPAGKEEEYTSLTVKDILKNKRGKTEIIVVADGWWPEPGIEDHKDVRMIRLADPIGQRAAQNMGARLSKAKYVMKLDSHCSVDEGFDVKMLEAFKEVGDNVTMVPLMRNLHVFNWKCDGCGKETYQGPVPEGCDQCDVNHFTKVIKWIPKQSPQSTAYRFNKDLRFKYFPELKRKQRGKLVESMSLQGSCFMATRENYWKLELCDETWGGWGQQGSEVAIKTWLSGGRVICNIDTWYSHLFRTQKGFSHPWGNPGSSQQNAIKTCQEIFFNNKWDKQVRPLSWLLEKFWDELKEVEAINRSLPKKNQDPVWTEDDLARIKKADNKLKTEKGMIFYTDNQLKLKIAHKVQNQLRSISKEKNIPIVSSSLKPMKMGYNIRLRLERGTLTMFKQILLALENSNAEIIFHTEHDVLYHPSHFDFKPPRKDKFYYNQNWVKVWPDGKAIHWDANQVSGLCAYKNHLIDYYKKRIEEVERDGFNRSYEPGGRDSSQYEVWNSSYPNIDIRHRNNVTRSHRLPEDFRDKSGCVNWQEMDINNIPGWEKLNIPF